MGFRERAALFFTFLLGLVSLLLAVRYFGMNTGYGNVVSLLFFMWSLIMNGLGLLLWYLFKTEK